MIEQKNQYQIRCQIITYDIMEKNIRNKVYGNILGFLCSNKKLGNDIK